MGATAVSRMIDGGRKRMPPFGREVLARRKSGQRVGLLVVAVSDWRAGDDWLVRDGVSRVVVPWDFELAAVDWSFARALDVLVVAGGGTPQSRLEAVAVSLSAADLNSLWLETVMPGSYELGVTEPIVFPHFQEGQRMYGGVTVWPASQLGRRLKARRELNALTCRGAFRAAPQFRNALLAQLEDGELARVDWPAVWRGEGSPRREVEHG